jgi:hypothetical protein
LQLTAARTRSKWTQPSAAATENERWVAFFDTLQTRKFTLFYY